MVGIGVADDWRRKPTLNLSAKDDEFADMRSGISAQGGGAEHTCINPGQRRRNREAARATGKMAVGKGIRVEAISERSFAESGVCCFGEFYYLRNRSLFNLTNIVKICENQ